MGTSIDVVFFLASPVVEMHLEARRNLAKGEASGLSYESLEVRNMMATFAVANLNDSGAGSLRQAIDRRERARPGPT